MTGISHTKDQNRFFGMKQESLSLPVVRPWKRLKAEQIRTVPPIIQEGQPLPPSQRLIVILPDANVDILSLPGRIWHLAAPDRQVLLMMRPCREENEFHALLNLTTLASLIQDSSVHVQTQLVLEMSLEQAARQCVQPGDVFVCFEEHQVSSLLKKRYLADILAQKTQQPVYALTGTVSELVDPISTRLVDFLFLALSLVSLVVFFALGVWVDRNSSGALQKVLQILVVIAEVWVVGIFATKSFRL